MQMKLHLYVTILSKDRQNHPVLFQQQKKVTHYTLEKFMMGS